MAHGLSSFFSSSSSSALSVISVVLLVKKATNYFLSSSERNTYPCTTMYRISIFLWAASMWWRMKWRGMNEPLDWIRSLKYDSPVTMWSTKSGWLVGSFIPQRATCVRKVVILPTIFLLPHFFFLLLFHLPVNPRDVRTVITRRRDCPPAFKRKPILTQNSMFKGPMPKSCFGSTNTNCTLTRPNLEVREHNGKKPPWYVRKFCSNTGLYTRKETEGRNVEQT